MRARSLHTAALGAAIAILAVVAPPARVDAAPVSACTTTAGVTVIVDFAHFGRAIERGCAPGHPADALDAIHAAGFDTAGTTRYGDAFLCRIDNLPTPKNEACAATPPAISSWSFYYARPSDATWTYTPIGVLSYHPAPGSMIAFAFGNLAKPGVRPAAAIPRPPTTVTTTHPTVPTAPPETAQAAQTTTTGALPTTAPVTAPRPSASHATTTVPSTVPAPTTSTSTRIVDRTATGTISRDSSGSPFPAAITAAIMLLLAAAAGVTIAARRRRST